MGILNVSAMQEALIKFVASDSSAGEGRPSVPRLGCCAIMATLLREFFAVTARVDLRCFACGGWPGCFSSFCLAGSIGVTLSPFWER